MRKMHIVLVLVFIIILGIGYLLRVKKNAGSSSEYYPITSPLKIKKVEKVYSLSYATLDPQAGQPIFIHTMATGMSWVTFIIPLPDSSYLITRFSSPVLPNVHSTQDLKYTHLYAKNKFSPIEVKLTYSDNGVLDGKIGGWGSGRVGSTIVESDLLIHYEPTNIVNIKNTEDFKIIQKLPGFSEATYQEVKN